MRRIDRVLEALHQLPEGQQATAGALADKLGLARANVSNDLNRLCREGAAQKQGSKPVYYSPASPAKQMAKAPARAAANQEPLDYFLSLNPSLYTCGEQAKAAVLYPPSGMHMLLLGETGTGKSMFAGLIYGYALRQKVVRPGGKLVSFNCADYAHNPQLLMSQLFGTQKGAYTGADADRAGFLEQADGGLLFLDEVHRLPPEGQEMLFTYIDRGVFRRLGETGGERKARVLLVCATTEDPAGTLLATFTRRIPMVIRIPSLQQRDMDERLTLITGFFVEEAKRLGHTIQASVNTLRSLMSYICPGNVGQLKTDIQIICAKAYAAYMSGKKTELAISSFDLPDNIREGLYIEKSHRHIYKRLGNLNQRFIDFSPDDTPTVFETGGGDNIYKLLENRTRDMERLGLSAESIEEEIEFQLHQYYQRIRSEMNITDIATGAERLVGPEIASTAKKLVEMAEDRLGVRYDSNIRFGLAIHLKNAIQRVEERRGITNPRLYAIRSKYPQAFEVGMQCLTVIEADFGIDMPADEAGFLAIFFAGGEAARSTQSTVEVLVAAHGPSTASSMAQTVNRLLGQSIVTGFDASLDEQPESVYQRMVAHLKARPGVHEVLLLVDMGSLAEFAHKLEDELGLAVRCMQLASTAHVLEAARAASMHQPLVRVWQQTWRVYEVLGGEKQLAQRQSPKKLFILTICTTGEGTARLLREVLSEKLDLTNRSCEVLAVQCSDERALQQRIDSIELGGEIIATVSSFAVTLPYPGFRLTQVLDGSAIPQLQQIVNVQATYLGIRSELFASLEALRDTNAFEDIKTTIGEMVGRLQAEVDEEIQIGMICHMGCMLDRLMRREEVSVFRDMARMVRKYPRELPVIQQAMEALGARYGVTVPMDEVCYATAFIMKEDLI